MKEKAELESEKTELTESLFVATESLRKMKNFITEKYSNMEQNLFKENAKNEGLEKKYKNIIRQMKTNEKRLYQENQNLKNKINESENEKSQMELNFQNRVQNMSLYNKVTGNNQNNSLMINNSFSPRTLQNTFINPNNNPLNQTNVNMSSPVRLNNSFTYKSNVINRFNSPNKIINPNTYSTQNSYMMTNINSNNALLSPNRNINMLNCQRFEDPREQSQKKTLEEFKKLLAKIDEKLDNPIINGCDS